MKYLAIGFLIIFHSQLGLIARETSKSIKPKDEANQKWFDKEDYKTKRWYLSLQAGTGVASTALEKGKLQTSKAGIEYRKSPFLGIGFSLGSNNLNLKSKDTSYSMLLAYLLLTSLNPSQSNSSQSANNQLLFATFLTTPISNFYLSDTFNYRYSTAQVDFNFHLNRDNFFDPYLGFGLIGGVCGSTYPCSITGGEIKLGAQLNFESFFTFFQWQGQVINIKEPGFASFQTQVSLGSLGMGFRF